MFDIIKYLRLFFTILLALFSLQGVNSQALVKLRSTLNTCGSSEIIASDGQKYYVQQSIGQSGIIGLSQNKNFLLRQGFIQPFKAPFTVTVPEIPQVKVFRDPFSPHITVLFTEEITDILLITLFDLNGKIVFCNQFEPAQELNLNVGTLAPSIYLLKVNTGTSGFCLKTILF